MSAVRFPFSPQHSPLRRRILQGMLAAGALTLAPGDLLAEAGVPLSKLPRYALVIGNGSYVDAPLANPANDARAIAGELKAAGFEVSVRWMRVATRCSRRSRHSRGCWRRAMRSACSTSPDTAPSSPGTTTCCRLTPRFAFSTTSRPVGSISIPCCRG